MVRGVMGVFGLGAGLKCHGFPRAGTWPKDRTFVSAGENDVPTSSDSERGETH